MTLPTQKFLRRFRSTPIAARDRIAFISLSGSLNPVHSEHMRAMEAARIALENVGWTIVAGFLAPADDQYLQGKLATESWPLEKRVRLCEAASSSSDWVDVCPWGEFRSYRLCATIREYLEHEHPEVSEGCLTGIEVMGSDATVRILDKNIADWDAAGAGLPWYQARVVCCLPRPGPESASEMTHVQRHTAVRAKDLGIELVMVDPEAIRPPLEAVSSSEIRALLAARDFDGLRTRAWLHPNVLAALAGEV